MQINTQRVRLLEERIVIFATRTDIILWRGQHIMHTESKQIRFANTTIFEILEMSLNNQKHTTISLGFWSPFRFGPINWSSSARIPSIFFFWIFVFWNQSTTNNQKTLALNDWRDMSVSWDFLWTVEVSSVSIHDFPSTSAGCKIGSFLTKWCPYSFVQ